LDARLAQLERRVLEAESDRAVETQPEAQEPGQEEEDGGLGERVTLPLFEEPLLTLPGDLATRDFFLQLPSHIHFLNGSELRLVLYPSDEVLSSICTVTVSMNGTELSGAEAGPVVSERPDRPGLRVRFPVPATGLQHGWNRVTIRFRLQQDPGLGAGAEAGAWILEREENHLRIEFERLPMFPELPRFPFSYTEGLLLRRAPGTIAGWPSRSCRRRRSRRR
jgi:hypothetical protein